MCTTRENTRVSPNDRLRKARALSICSEHRQFPQADPEIPDEVKPDLSDEDIKKHIPWKVTNHFSAHVEVRETRNSSDSGLDVLTATQLSPVPSTTDHPSRLPPLAIRPRQIMMSDEM